MNQLVRVLSFFIIAAVVVSFSGCGPRLISEQVLELESNDIRTILINPTDIKQNVSITATTDGAPIKVFVYLSDDEEVVNRAVTFQQPSDKIIASQLDTANASLSAEIPANKEASIRLQTASREKAMVTLTISN